MYTHTDYKFVWPLWFGQTKKYLSDYEKIIFVNEYDSNIPLEYKVIKYDENLNYNQRVLQCFEKLGNSEIVIFHHEDMFLYDEPNHKVLDEFKNLILTNNKMLVKLIRAGNGDQLNNLHKNLFKNPRHLNFAIQPTIAKVELFKQIYSNNQGDTIWEFERNAANNLNTEFSYFCYDNESLRGLAHYDSNIYPYIATAVVKGKWNLLEYKNELGKLFYEYKINNL